jgi:hypothetical protein
MIDRQPSKRLRPQVNKNSLSLEDQEAFERVARITNRPLSEFFDESPNHTSIRLRNNVVDPYPAEEVMFSGPTPWSATATQWADIGWQQQISGEVDNRTFQSNGLWTNASGIVFEEDNSADVNFNQWTQNISQAPAFQAENAENNDDARSPNQRPRRSSSWSHEATADEPWVAVPTNFLAQASLQDNVIDDTDIGTRLENTLRERPANDSTSPSQDNRSNLRLPSQNRNTIDRISNLRSSSPSSDLIDSDGVSLDWEELMMPQVSSPGSQIPCFADTGKNGWSLIEKSKPQDIFSLEKSKHKSLKWVSTDSSGKELSSQKPQRRRAFQDQQLREETSITRKLKACVRCQRQKIRVSVNPTALTIQFNDHLVPY